MQVIPIEIVEHISTFVPKVSILCRFKRTCKSLYSRIILESRQNDNHILILLRLYPKKFFHSRIYTHPDITPDIVRKYPEIKWNYRILSDITKKDPQRPSEPADSWFGEKATRKEAQAAYVTQYD